MSYFAAAAIRNDGEWIVSELDLSDIEDVEDLAPVEEAAARLRDIAEGDVALLFVEVDDEYLIIVRLDEEEGDLRIFGSDVAYAEESPLVAALLGDLEPESALPELNDDSDEAHHAGNDDDEELPVADTDITPIGDIDLLTDLGISAGRLLALCTQEGMLPSDVTAEIFGILGCADELEKLRNV